MSVGQPARFRSPSRRVDRRLPPAVLFGERPWNRGATAAGIIGTILFHLLVVMVTPRVYVADGFGKRQSAPEELDLVLMPFEEPESEDLQYVETNQAAPENRPDRTNAFSARDQQAANELEPEELSADRTPAREGEDDLPFDKAFTGDLNPPLDALPAPEVPETAEANPQQSETSNPFEQNPLAGVEEDQSEDAESVAEEAPNPMPIEEPVEGEETPSEDESPVSFAATPSLERPAPAPRPRLPRALPGPVSHQRAGVPQVGYVGYDANASRFGEYMERMSEAVQQHWESKAANRVHEPGTRVVVEFDLTRDGAIENLIVRDATANGIGVLAVRAALEQGQPYGPWTEDMVTIFGDRETLTFTFYYW